VTDDDIEAAWGEVFDALQARVNDIFLSATATRRPTRRRLAEVNEVGSVWRSSACPSFGTIHVDVLRLAADTDDECLEVGVLAGRLSVDRLGRNDEEVAGARDHALGAARAEVDRHGPTEDVDVGFVGSMVMPATRIARIVPDPVGPAAFAFKELAPFDAWHRWRWLSLVGMMNDDRSGSAHGRSSGIESNPGSDGDPSHASGRKTSGIGIHVGRTSAFDSCEQPKVGVRSQEWTAIGTTELDSLRETSSGPVPT
jgi:hypothetical protein